MKKSEVEIVIKLNKYTKYVCTYVYKIKMNLYGVYMDINTFIHVCECMHAKPYVEFLEI